MSKTKSTYTVNYWLQSSPPPHTHTKKSEIMQHFRKNPAFKQKTKFKSGFMPPEAMPKKLAERGTVICARLYAVLTLHGLNAC